jgi:protein phosphatase
MPLIKIPELSLVVLIGASGSGKSTFARQHFRPTEIISSDHCRGLVSDDETDQSVSAAAFEIVHLIAAKRLELGKLTVIDATNVQPEARRSLLDLAQKYHCIPVAIVLNLPEATCHARNQQRPDRNFGSHVVRRQTQDLKRSLRNLQKQGFRQVHILNSAAEILSAQIERQPLWTNLKHERGPFDLIGDVHGCCDELETLLQSLGYQQQEAIETGFWNGIRYVHPEGRKAVFLGDLVDRGNRILDTLKLVRNMVTAGAALCVPGTHDLKLLRHLQGKTVRINHGLEQTLEELAPLSPKDTIAIQEFLQSLISHYVLDEGRLVVAHAGMKQEFQGRASAKVRDFALYGETTGEIDEFGLPVRHNWAAEYRGKAIVVYGHTPVPTAEWLNNTIDIDTGCVFGGHLTALRYPERELISVPAARVYCQPVKPLQAAVSLTAQQAADDMLDLGDVLGKRQLTTRLHRPIAIRAENAIAALEIISRFAINPKWLIYLPPTMSPVETSALPGFLEHPAEAFAYYQKQGITDVICEEKHMGSRSVAIVCRHEAAARQRFGVENEGIGVCYTRTGRQFFEDFPLAAEFLAQVNQALTASDFWERFQTDWVCLDCELMPWSAKAQGLIREQYAAVGASGRQSFADALSALEQAQQRGIDVSEIQRHYQQRSGLVHRYVDAYRRYCWDVKTIADFKLAPFHILATEGAVHIHQDHVWHLAQISQFCQHSDLLLTTNYKTIHLADDQQVQAGIRWWEELTRSGGEGMVVKPLSFVVSHQKGLIQPAVKCRGQEYLRIIYGAEYTLPEHLERLRQRGLAGKRSLALREFALGIEALERFVKDAPLRQVHECVFGVLALESEPVDPRL